AGWPVDAPRVRPARASRFDRNAAGSRALAKLQRKKRDQRVPFVAFPGRGRVLHSRHRPCSRLDPLSTPDPATPDLFEDANRLSRLPPVRGRVIAPGGGRLHPLSELARALADEPGMDALRAVRPRSHSTLLE